MGYIRGMIAKAVPSEFERIAAKVLSGDRISFDDHLLAKRAKDIGSAAVFLSLASCALVGLLVLADQLT